MGAAVAADVARIACPVLVLSGRDDSVSPVAIGEGLAAELPSATFRVLEHCGHWHPIEQPSEVNAALRAFL